MGFEFPALLIILAVLSGLSIYSLRIDPARINRTASRQNVYLCLLALLLTLLVLEFATRLFVIQSDNFGFTVSARRWEEKYWNPINAQGYRDREWSESSRHSFIAVGDSFAAGAGVKSIEHRFSGVLETLLGGSWHAITLAKPGWHTGDQIEALREFPREVDFVVLSYVINDILGAAEEIGELPTYELSFRPQYFSWFVAKSAFINYLYYRSFRLFKARLSNSYWDHVVSLFSNPEVMEIQKRQLRELYQTAKSKSPQVVALVFPDLRSLTSSAAITRKIGAIYSELGAEVIDLSPLLSSRSADELTVNSLDAHPSEAVHSFAAQLIADKVAARHAQDSSAE